MKPSFLASIIEDKINIGVPIKDDLYLAIACECCANDVKAIIYLRNNFSARAFSVNPDAHMGISGEVTENFFDNPSNVTHHEIAEFMAIQCGFEFDRKNGAKSAIVMASTPEAKEDGRFNIIVLPVGNHMSVAMTIQSDKTVHVSIKNISEGCDMSLSSDMSYTSVAGASGDRTLVDIIKESVLAPENKRQLPLFPKR